MPSDVRFYVAAELDLDRLADSYATEGGMTVVARFAAAVDETLTDLSRFPRLGHAHPSLSRRHRAVRAMPVRGFANILIFYRIRRRTVWVMRVLHGARDVGSMISD